MNLVWKDPNKPSRVQDLNIKEKTDSINIRLDGIESRDERSSEIKQATVDNTVTNGRCSGTPTPRENGTCPNHSITNPKPKAQRGGRRRRRTPKKSHPGWPPNYQNRNRCRNQKNSSMEHQMTQRRSSDQTQIKSTTKAKNHSLTPLPGITVDQIYI